MQVGVLINPAAEGGRLRIRLPDIQRVVRTHFPNATFHVTNCQGDASRIAAIWGQSGFGLVVAVGGDGTASETVDGLLSCGSVGPRPAFAILPQGTGSDFARGLGLEEDWASALAAMASGRSRAIDVGRITWTPKDGPPRVRHFLNIASLGLSAAIVARVNASPIKRRLPGKLTFLLATLQELLAGRFPHVRVSVDDAPAFEAEAALVALANGRRFGGGMLIAPDARVDDGILEIVVVEGRSRAKLLADLRLVYSGAHRASPACRFLRGRSVSIEPAADDPARIECDGEEAGMLPAHFEILPGALTLLG